MIVISNTSPIINLAAIEHLELLRGLYGTITIPQAVFTEIVIDGAGRVGAKEVQTSPWFELREVIGSTHSDLLRLDIDKGEAEAITLALELEADLLLMDERKGRIAADLLGLQTLGLLGLLVDAKQQGFITLVKPLLDDLIEKASFWVSRPLYERVLQAVGE